MAVLTYAAQLEEVQTAITAILSGAQSVSSTGRSYTYANLKDLQERETYLRRMTDRETNGGITIKQGTPVDA